MEGLQSGIQGKALDQQRLLGLGQSASQTAYASGQSRGYYSTSKQGLGVASTAAFIIGGMAGAGVLALPFGLVLTGWIGIAMIVFAGVVSAYTGVLLGDCWSVLLAHWPGEYSTSHIRHPYPAIAERAIGRWAHTVVVLCIDVTLFSVCTVFLLLVSENLSSLFPGHLSHRIWIVVVAGILLPLCLLESPKDSPVIAYSSCVFTGVATIIVLVLLEKAGPQENAFQPPVTFESFCLGLATIVFLFGGHSAFPTFQHDMNDTSKFWLAIIVGYIGIFTYNIPLGVAGFELFGNHVKPNILLNLGQSTAATVVKWMFTLHIFCAYIIAANPLSQDLERLLSAPQSESFGVHFNFINA